MLDYELNSIQFNINFVRLSLNSIEFNINFVRLIMN